MVSCENTRHSGEECFYWCMKFQMDVHGDSPMTAQFFFVFVQLSVSREGDHKTLQLNSDNEILNWLV